MGQVKHCEGCGSEIDNGEVFCPNPDCGCVHSTEKNLITIMNEENNVMVSIRNDGRLEYGEGYSPDLAAQRFWLSLSESSPSAYVQKLEDELEYKDFCFRVLKFFLIIGGGLGSLFVASVLCYFLFY
ncbi:MAG: hypothetical protein DRN81_03065 [Thermoproteota archaeon]|nr:MAG: hypothetical protein DRN81_03065 [Candidatus Korarchaeota archaeon]